MATCSYCRGIRLVGWSGAGPILCPECSKLADGETAFSVLTKAWREQRTRVVELENALAAKEGATRTCPTCHRMAWDGMVEALASDRAKVSAAALAADRARIAQAIREEVAACDDIARMNNQEIGILSAVVTRLLRVVEGDK